MRQVPWLLIPSLMAVAVLAWTNWIRFGEPWLTGYHQWRANEHALTGSWRDGIWGVMFDARGSMLFHFPVLIFGLCALRSFYRRYKLDLVVVLLLPAALFFFLTKMPIWRGEWAYGPRLFIFMLPVIALPFLTYLEWLGTTPWRWTKRIMAVATIITLGYSTYLQYQVNRLDFWTYYHILYTFDGDWSPETSRYFTDHQFGTFNADLIHHRDNLDDLAFLADLEKRGLLRGQELQDYKQMLRHYIDDENFYWKRRPAH